MATAKLTLEQRFWSKVDRRGPDECWPWLGGATRAGYGCFGLSSPRRVSVAHRVAWELANGPIPGAAGRRGTCVLHRCDFPPCCNPAHLFLGTHGDNAADKVQKGRQARGTGMGNARLSEDDVRAIRALRAGGMTCVAVGARFGIHATHVSEIERRLLWAHVP